VSNQETKQEPDVRIEHIKKPYSEDTRVVHRDSKGMFKKQKRKPLTSQEIKAATVIKLTALAKGEDRTQYEKVIDSMLQISQNPTEKTASASVKAGELLLRVAGVLDDETKNVTNNKIETVIVNSVPPEMMEKMLDDLKKRGISEVQPAPVRPSPAFLEAQFAEDQRDSVTITPEAPKTTPTNDTEKVSVSVESLMAINEKQVMDATRGIPFASLSTRAEKDDEVVINDKMQIITGLLRVGAAHAIGMQTITVLRKV